MPKPSRASQRKKGRGVAGQDQPASPSHPASSNPNLLESSQLASEKATQVPKKKGQNTKATKREQSSPAPTPAVPGGGPQWFDYRDLSPSVASLMSQTRPEDLSQGQLAHLFRLSQDLSPAPPHPYQHLSGLVSNIHSPIIPPPPEITLEEKQKDLMANHRKGTGRHASVATLGGGVGDLQISEDRVASTTAATQKRKRPGSQLQRETPQIPKAEPTVKEVANPLDCKMAKERAQRGQFAVHSELSAGGILHSQLASCKELLEDLGKILGKLPANRRDPHVKIIQADIKEFLSCTIDGGGIVGFLGQAGVGKTTLLNALLDLEDFLPDKEDGRCMPIVLEFAKSRPELGPFTMDVKYITRAQLEEDAEVLFREVYVEGTKLQKPHTREAVSIQKRLNHLFPGAKWSSLSDVREDITKLFAEDECLQQEDGIIRGMDQEACAEKLRDLTVSFSNDRPSEPERWPLVEKIRIYLDSEILNTGAIIADIPGIDDGGTRVKAMQTYLSGVQDLIIVTKLEHIFVDNVDVLQKIGYEGVTFLDGRSRGVLVTNHLDEYTPAKAKALFKKNVPFMADLNKAEGDLKHGHTHYGNANRGDQKKGKAEMTTIIQKSDKTLEQICSKILDEYIEPQATVTFGSTIPTDDITWQVFRVDAIGYTKSKKDGTFLAHFQDDMNIQQVVELQDCIGAMTYPRQFRLAVFRIKQAQSLIANLLFWCSSEVRLPPAIRSFVEKSLLQEIDNLQQEMEVVRLEMAQKVSDSLAAVYANAEITVYEATEKAQQRMMDITANANTTRFICRAGGEFTDINWNTVLLEDVRESMCDLWKKTITFTIQVMNNFQTAYFEAIEAIEFRFEEFINGQDIDNTIKAAFRNLITKELQNGRSYLVEICRDNVRIIHNMFRHGARTFLRPDALKELM
ncbi:hypothetical protein TWF506_006248 [Arthrobotrys conoides]|uniref:Uncharacterized protein n=1 Tax=Arthrobotrys conoides TaxID=74498 RepID=A0AAN8NBT2_9PEZI